MAGQGRSPWSRESGEWQPVPGVRENSREAESVRVPDTACQMAPVHLLEGQSARTTFGQAVNVNGAEDRSGQPQSDRGLMGAARTLPREDRGVNCFQGKGQPFGDRAGPC